ncbi:MAG: YdcF family protein [Bacteroidales bacterium]|nr:YdcF family protein [Bacteroidales bacterium]
MKNKTYNQWRIWLVRIVIAVVGACVLLIVGCNLVVKLSAKGRIYTDVQDVPYRKVGLLLGTAPNRADGSPNQYFQNRIEAAARLYRFHKVSYFLISGDNCRHGYNEPEAMRQSLIQQGVPDTAIFLDYAGFRTYDSMIRSKVVFGQDSVTVISQYWHNERAVFIARCSGIDAIAFNASDVHYRKSFVKNHLRELVAKVKAVGDVVFGNRPRFLGDTVEIPGGQTTAYKDSIKQLGFPSEVLKE